MNTQFDEVTRKILSRIAELEKREAELFKQIKVNGPSLPRKKFLKLAEEWHQIVKEKLLLEQRLSE